MALPEGSLVEDQFALHEARLQFARDGSESGEKRGEGNQHQNLDTEMDIHRKKPPNPHLPKGFPLHRDV
jgi:hypothetical protein